MESNPNSVLGAPELAQKDADIRAGILKVREVLKFLSSYETEADRRVNFDLIVVCCNVQIRSEGPHMPSLL